MPNELIHLRIGSWVLHPDAMVLPVAGLFFAVLAYRALWPALFVSRRHVKIVVMLMCLGGISGARLYGLFQPFYAGEPVLADGAWRALRFGSMGGIWGIFLATGGSAMAMRRTDALTVLDAIVPAVCMSAAIARVACVFQGCCVGVSTGPLAAITNPVYAWPFLDMAALLATLVAVHVASERWHMPGVQLIVFLGGYGVLRFGAEVLRDTYMATANFTWGQLFAIVQVFIAAALAAYIKVRTSRQIVLRV